MIVHNYLRYSILVIMLLVLLVNYRYMSLNLYNSIHPKYINRHTNIYMS